jgi:hypothetical protein
LLSDQADCFPFALCSIRLAFLSHHGTPPPSILALLFRCPFLLNHNMCAPLPSRCTEPRGPRQAAPDRLPRRGGPGWHSACYSTGQCPVTQNAEKRTHCLVAPKVVKNPTMVVTGAPESALRESASGDPASGCGACPA